MTQLTHLFQPGNIGNLKIKNRLVLDAMGLGYQDENGKPLPRLKTFLVERAKGGVGFISVSCALTREVFNIGPSLGDDVALEDLRDIVSEIHKYDVPVAAEIVLLSQWTDGTKPLELCGPSAMSFRPGVPVPRELSVDEIHTIHEQYVSAARRAKEAGFDGVEIMAGAGNIPNRFISSASNQRTDEYGGTLEKRVRFFTEIVEKIHKGVGEDFPVGCRFSPIDYIEGGHDLEMGKQAAVLMEKSGLAWISVQVGWHDSQIHMLTKDVEEGHWSFIAAGIKQAVKIPVITSYQISDPVIAERLLAEGKADFVGMARAFVADPEYANKAREGRLDDIRRCIYCCRCLDQAIAFEVPLDICSVNPRIGKELDREITPADKPKKVIIVGAGPGGMEAARVAKMRGHDVTVFDKNPRPGGLMTLACILNPEVEKVVKFLTRQLNQLGIKVKTGVNATASMLEQLKPDAVILAVGGGMPHVQIPGADGDNVFGLRSATAMMTGQGAKGKDFLPALFLRYFYNPSLIRSLMKMNYPFKKRIVIIGGKFGGLEFAETFGEKGKQVTVLEESGRIGYDIGPVQRWITLDILRKYKVVTETNTKVTEITRHSVKAIKKAKDGSEKAVEYPADTVLITPDLLENKDLANGLEGDVPICILIGDATERGKAKLPIWGPVVPRRLGESIKAGFNAAMDL